MPSDSNQVSVFFAQETAWGETPDNSKALQELGCSSANLKPENVFEESAEIRPDSQLANDTKVGEEVTASIATQLSMQALNAFLPAVLGASGWTTATSGAVTATIASSGQTITLASGSYHADFAYARYVKVDGSATSANNGIKKVVSVSAGVLTLAAGSLTANDAGATLTITAKYAKVGTTLTSFLLEEKFALMNAGANKFKYLTGQCVNKLALDIQPRSIVKATLDFMGKTGAYADATMGDGSPLSKTGLPHITTNANVGTIYWGGTAVPVPVQSIPLSIMRNLRVRPALSQQNTLEFGLNQFDLTGNINSYFLKDDMVDDMVASTKRALEFYLNDSGGKVLNFYAPLVLLKRNGHPDPTAKNTDVMTGFEFRGLGSDALKALQIDYLEA